MGLFAADFAHLHGLNTIIFDSLNEVGGQPNWLYPFKQIADIPVFDSITGSDLIKKLHNNIKDKVTIQTNYRVEKVKKNTTGFKINDDYQAKTIIIATGVGSFKPKKFPLKSTPEINNRIHYYIQNPALFKNQTVGIFGGGDSALDWGVELSKYANIKLIHRRKEFRGLESSVRKLNTLDNVELLTPYLPKHMELKNDKLSIELREVGSNNLLTQNFDQIVVAYGFRSDNRLIKQWGIDLTPSHIKVDQEMKTNIDGIYAIGDAVNYPGRVPVIGLGFGEAQIAITAIMRQLFPEKTLTIHSTSI